VTPIEALLLAPVVGMDPDDTSHLHAVPSSSITLNIDRWATVDRIDAACGAHVKVVPGPMSWPPPVVDHQIPRCPTCRFLCGGRVKRRLWKREVAV